MHRGDSLSSNLQNVQGGGGSALPKALPFIFISLVSAEGYCRFQVYAGRRTVNSRIGENSDWDEENEHHSLGILNLLEPEGSEW